jgi:hypothetical protein
VAHQGNKFSLTDFKIDGAQRLKHRAIGSGEVLFYRIQLQKTRHGIALGVPWVGDFAFSVGDH